MSQADNTHSTIRPALPPVPIDFDADLGVMRGAHELIARLDYEARVRVLGRLARRFVVDTGALRF